MAAATLLLIASAAASQDPGASRSCADAAEAAWGAAERNVWGDLISGKVVAGPKELDLGALLARALTCEGLSDRLADSGLVLHQARIGSLNLDNSAIAVRFVCRECEIGTLSARRSDWHADLDLSGSYVAERLDLARSRFRGDLLLDALRTPFTGDPKATRIDLSGARLDGDLIAGDGQIAGGLSLSGASLGGSLTATDTVLYELDLSDARLGGHAVLDRIRLAGSLRLAEAGIGGRLSMKHSEIVGPLAAPGLRLGSTLRVDSAQLRSIELEGARIDGHVILSGARIASHVDLDKARVAGDVWIRRYDAGPPPTIGINLAGKAPTGSDVLTLRNTEIGGRVDISGAAFNGGLNFDAARIGEDLWLRRGSIVEGRIVAIYARIGQNLDLSGTTLGDLDATGAVIGGELRLGAPGTGSLVPPTWREGARLTLRNAQVSALVDGEVPIDPPDDTCPAAPASGNSWPESIDVIGFRYKRFGGLGGGSDVRRSRCGWYVDWLARQQPFSLDPYRHLAEHLESEGNSTAARHVKWAAKQRQLGQAEGLEFWRLLSQKIFVGYGIYTYVVFAWMAAFVALGAAVFSRTPEARQSSVPLAFVFSLDMLLPFLSFRRAHGDVDLQGPVRFYLYFHKFMGWVFALFFVSALGGLFEV